jgi:hypothetical protein
MPADARGPTRTGTKTEAPAGSLSARVRVFPRARMNGLAASRRGPIHDNAETIP